MTKTELIKSWVEIIAIVFAGLWAFYIFIYSEYIKATQFFDATIEMESYSALPNELVHVQIKIKLTNPSSRRLFIEAAYYEVHGDIIEADNRTQFSPEKYEEALNDDAFIANGCKPSCSELIGGGGFLTGAWADPKESLYVNRVIYVPKARFSHLECNIYVQSVINPDLIDIRKTVNNDYSVDWQVRKAQHIDNIWLSKSDMTGYKLLDSNATLKRTNAFLALSNTAPNKANSAGAKSSATD
jgi:hypothetical protein